MRNDPTLDYILNKVAGTRQGGRRPVQAEAEFRQILALPSPTIRGERAAKWRFDYKDLGDGLLRSITDKVIAEKGSVEK